MKKSIYGLVALTLLSFSTVTLALNELPGEFKPECYEYYDRVESFTIKKGQSYKLDINKSGFLLVQSGSIVPYTAISSQEKVLDSFPPFSDMTDKNPRTFIELDSWEDKEFLLWFQKQIIAQEFEFIYDFDLKYHRFEFFISSDGERFQRVTKESIYDFSFSYFKVVFIPLNPGKEIRESIKLRELMFTSSRKQYAFTAIDNTVLEVYNYYKCSWEELQPASIKKDIEISTDTPVVYATLRANPKYNTYTLFDKDNDWVEDSLDNCPNHYNPDQKDNNSDGKGNMCSDVDTDGYLGYEDICPYLYNPKQYDINSNGIGDACEFDKDKDGIYDSIDNCVSFSNPGQADADNDGIGNLCDNCKYYNPAQLDTNENGVWDTCDDKDTQFLENDDDKDGILNWSDNCRTVANQNQRDIDKDGVGDVCDNCKKIKNSKQTDKDKNGVGDICEDIDDDGYVGYLDNCMYVFNRDQIDSDNNGVGNSCEDMDRDGKIHVEDNCPYLYNPEQGDVDKDTIGDACDEVDDRVLESNKPIFILILLAVVLIFLFGIYRVVQKLK